MTKLTPHKPFGTDSPTLQPDRLFSSNSVRPPATIPTIVESVSTNCHLYMICTRSIICIPSQIKKPQHCFDFAFYCTSYQQDHGDDNDEEWIEQCIADKKHKCDPRNKFQLREQVMVAKEGNARAIVVGTTPKNVYLVYPGRKAKGIKMRSIDSIQSCNM